MLTGRPRLFVTLALGLGTVLVANLLFLALMVAAQTDPRVIAERVRAAFEAGELGTSDYRRFDTRRGYFQHNDCLILQMLTNEDSSRLERALAPNVYANARRNKWCAGLRALVVEGVDRNTLEKMRYARYWHGYNALAAMALRRLELREFRRLLSAAVWGAIGALTLAAAYRSGRHVRRTGLAIAFAAATVWAVPYFARGLSQGPGDALLLLGLAAVAIWPRLTARLDTVVTFAACFGAAVVFLEMFTGQLPTALAWLAAMVLAASRNEKREGGLAAHTATLAAVTAFVLAAAATVALKQVMALLATSETTEAFRGHLHR
ncbi:MAG: hypothetical protein ABI968_15290, partial [Acidobacteriota bacterium]